MNRKRTLSLWKALMASGLFFMIAFTSCEDLEETKIVPHDPSRPIKISEYMPDSARVATQLLIWGENFGGNKDSISVFIKGKKASVIGVNPEGTLLYCLVPSMMEEGVTREDGEEINVAVKMVVGGAESETSDSLHYTFSQNVSTFLGFTDQDGNTAVVDGSFERAQFQSPFWMAFDSDIDDTDHYVYGKPRKNIYLIEENVGLRFIDVYNKEVRTIFRTGNGVDRPRTIAFTLNRDNREYNCDTMIIANDHGEWGGIGTIIIPRDSVTRIFGNSTGTTPWRAVMHHRQCNGGAIHPITGDYWFNSYQNSQVYKVFSRAGEIWRYGKSAGELNEDGKEGTNFVFKVQDNNWEFNIQIAPDGSFAYIVSKNQHYIARTMYNHSQNLFENPTPFVGSKQKRGYQDGAGINTLFWEPQQGAFDKDNNFYVCDGENHCIRKVTPEGQVSVFAGRPEMPGFSDGALRDAQFDSPFGIIYDEEIQTFYVADRDNRRIRTIKIE